MGNRSVITEADVLAAAKRGESQLILPKRALVTPLGRDTARRVGVQLIEELGNRSATSDSATSRNTASRNARPDALSSIGGGLPVSSKESKESKEVSPNASPAPRVVAIGADHGGFDYKQELANHIEGLGWTILDVGTHSNARCDYPDFAFAVAHAVAIREATFGVMIDGAGPGSAIVANKVHGIRAACAYMEFAAFNARAHNDCNVLTLGSRAIGIEVCKRIVRVFLEVPFEGGRHLDRVNKIRDVENHFARDRRRS